MQQVIVYVDQGVDGIALKHTVKTLNQEIDHTRFELQRADANRLKTTDWEKETALIVIPGGRDVYYHACLDGIGTEKIRGFVENGGAYLGICAGAYFACSVIEFEKGGVLEVCGQRSLSFFPGMAQGPAYGKNRYSYDGLHGLEAANISWKNEAFHAYFNGGCHFAKAAEYPHVSVLSSYLDLDQNPAAVISCQVGLGKAILMGVHLEYNTTALHRQNPYIERIYSKLQQGENHRKQVFREILNELLDR
jgi:biotin--protein ligase